MTTECATKERFDSREKAARVATRINDRKKRSKQRGCARAYRCRLCSGWHLYKSEGMARHFGERMGAA